MPKYSIITPAYNSFDLMERYFSSLENQTFKDFEVIIVDDCSTDGSYEKLVAYAEQSSLNIHLHRTPINSGPGEARNIGIDNACGEWITFIDNDDWVETVLLERIDWVIMSNQVNCVIYDYFIQKDSDVSVGSSMYFGENGLVNLSNALMAVRNHTIGKFYRREKCTQMNIRFPEIRRCEDVAFVCQAVAACESVYYLHEPLYYYYQRSGSLSNNRNMDETDMLKAFTILEEKLGNIYPNEIKAKSVCDLLYGVLLMMCKAGKRNREIKDYIRAYCQKYPEWEQCQIINHIGASKKLFLKAAQFRTIPILKLMALIHTRMIG